MFEIFSVYKALLCLTHSRGEYSTTDNTGFRGRVLHLPLYYITLVFLYLNTLKNTEVTTSIS